MKEKILAALKTKFSGVQDAILNRVATKLSETVGSEDDVQGVVDSTTFQQVLESYGDSRATEASRTSIVNYESKYGLKNGSPAKGTDPAQPNTPDDTPQWAKDLIRQNQELASKVSDFERKTNGERLSGLVKSKLKSQGVEDSFFIGRPINVENEDQIDQVVDTMIGYWNEISKDRIKSDVPPRSFNSSPGGKAVDADIDSWAQKS